MLKLTFFLTILRNILPLNALYSANFSRENKVFIMILFNLWILEKTILLIRTIVNHILPLSTLALFSRVLIFFNSKTNITLFFFSKEDGNNLNILGFYGRIWTKPPRGEALPFCKLDAANCLMKGNTISLCLSVTFMLSLYHLLVDLMAELYPIEFLKWIADESVAYFLFINPDEKNEKNTALII